MTDETRVELEVPVVARAEKVSCEEFCCNGGPRWTAEERAEKRQERAVAKANAARLLGMAEDAAMNHMVERAKALTEIASAWDSLGY